MTNKEYLKNLCEDPDPENLREFLSTIAVIGCRCRELCFFEHPKGFDCDSCVDYWLYEECKFKTSKQYEK